MIYMETASLTRYSNTYSSHVFENKQSLYIYVSIEKNLLTSNPLLRTGLGAKIGHVGFNCYYCGFFELHHVYDIVPERIYILI